MKIAVVLFDGFDELDAFGPYEVLANAARLGADATVELVSIEPTAHVVGSHGVRVTPDGVLSDGTELVVVPGGGWNDRAPRGAWAEAERGDLPDALARLHGEGATIASVCTGAMLLARAGLLEGRPATTHRGALEDLAASGAKVERARVVDAGEILTAAGVTAGIDLALWIVEREWDPGLARRIADELEHERRGPISVG